MGFAFLIVPGFPPGAPIRAGLQARWTESPDLFSTQDKKILGDLILFQILFVNLIRFSLPRVSMSALQIKNFDIIENLFI